MRQRDLAALAGGLLDRQRDLERGLAPAAVMHRFLAFQDGGTHIVEHVVAARVLAATRQRDLALARLIVDVDTVRRGAQVATRAGRDGEPEVRLVRRLAVVRAAVAGELRAQPRLR